MHRVGDDTTWEQLEIENIYLIFHDKNSILFIQKPPFSELPTFPNTLQKIGNNQQTIQENVILQLVNNTGHEIQIGTRILPSAVYFGHSIKTAPKFHYFKCLIFVIELSKDIYKFVLNVLPGATSRTIPSIPSILLGDLSKSILFDQQILQIVNPNYQPNSQINNWSIPTQQDTIVIPLSEEENYFPVTAQSMPQAYDVSPSSKAPVASNASSAAQFLGNAPPPAQGTQLTKSQIQKLLEQIDFYFSDTNFPRDKFLLKQADSHGGGIPVETIESFKRIIQLLNGQSFSALFPEFYQLKNCRFDSNENKLYRIDRSALNQAAPVMQPTTNKPNLKHKNNGPASANAGAPKGNVAAKNKPVSLHSRIINDVEIKVTTGSIFSETADAIALAQVANTNFLDGKMGNILAEYAGPKLAQEIDTYLQHFTVSEGGALITSSHKLNNCKFVIHAVCPYWKNADEPEKKLYTSAIVDSLHHAERSDCNSVAFSVFAMNKVPDNIAAQLMLSMFKNYASYVPAISSPKVHSICICVPPKLYQLFKDELDK